MDGSSWNSSGPADSNSCLFPEVAAVIISLLVVHTSLLPLLVFVLVVGLKRWRKPRLHASSTPSSHLDVFTYNAVVLDMLFVCSVYVFYFGAVTKETELVTAGIALYGVASSGQILFHVLTCAERYLAVVRPVLYLRLRGAGGVRIRNLVAGGAWLFSFLYMLLIIRFNLSFIVMNVVFLTFTSLAFCLSSVSVACALVRSRPAQSKLRQFHTLLVITAVLALRFLVNLSFTLTQMFVPRFGFVYCLLGWASLWFFLPSGLVLPLLFLQRAGTLPLCRRSSQRRS